MSIGPCEDFAIISEGSRNKSTTSSTCENVNAAEWEIEKILGERKRYSRKEYLIEWKGFP